MKTVQLTIEVVVPDGCGWIAMDADGTIYGYASKPEYSTGYEQWASLGDSVVADMINTDQAIVEVE